MALGGVFLVAASVFKYVTRTRAALLWTGATLTIVVVLAASVSWDSFSSMHRARPVAARMQIAAWMTALDAYKADVGNFPSDSEGLTALRTNPGVARWNGPYLRSEVPKDPWGAPYQYSIVAGQPRVLSLGGSARGVRPISSEDPLPPLPLNRR